ncbi:hypothetical protein HanIR_Chr17g0845981 [Helianthus annuus]|nr:hypothetical protein HanIR_Chr17g0845981 [Helianthus annuus]
MLSLMKLKRMIMMKKWKKIKSQQFSKSKYSGKKKKKKKKKHSRLCKKKKVETKNAGSMYWCLHDQKELMFFYSVKTHK